MDVPKNVTVGGIKYSIKQTHPCIRPNVNETVWGYVDFEKCEIGIDKNLATDKKKTVLMHELIHTIDEAVGLGFSEEVTDRIAVAIVDTLTRNKLDLNA